MNPTYSTSEVLSLIPSLDLDEMEILGEVLMEERKRYCLEEIKLLCQVFKERTWYLVKISLIETLAEIRGIGLA